MNIVCDIILDISSLNSYHLSQYLVPTYRRIVWITKLQALE